MFIRLAASQSNLQTFYCHLVTNLMRNFGKIFAKVFTLLHGQVGQRDRLRAPLPDRLENLRDAVLRQGSVRPLFVVRRIIAVHT